MKKTSLIGHVCELLDLIRPLKLPADTVARDFFRARHYLGSKDRRFISDITFGILRNYRLLHVFGREALQPLEQPSLFPLVLYISYALKVLGEERTQILEDVDSNWRISFPKLDCQQFLDRLANAELPEEIQRSPVLRIAVRYSFPDSIVEEWVGRFGEEEAQKLCEAMNRPAPVVVRVNSLKTSVEACRTRLLGEGIESEPTGLSPSGLILKKRINAQALQSFLDGWFEVQDEGSQLIAILLEPLPGQVVVDACAGGGGKTVHISALMRNEGELHATDTDERRLAAIRPRLIRSGVSNAQLHLLEKGKEFSGMKGKADAVLVDAPCSGVGTFRRNPAAKLGFDGDVVARLSATQRSILELSSGYVRPGGRLVYSTCTLLRRENEDVVESFLRGHDEFRALSASEILKRQHIPVELHSESLTLLPHKTGTDGFFVAAMQRQT